MLGKYLKNTALGEDEGIVVERLQLRQRGTRERVIVGLLLSGTGEIRKKGYLTVRKETNHVIRTDLLQHQ